MNANRTIILLLALCAATAAQASYVTDIVAQMPLKNSAEEGALAAKLAANGAPAVKELCGLLVPLGTEGKDDTGVRYAFGALVRHAGRPGGEADRAALVAGITQSLAGDGDVEVRTFLINRLQDVGRDDAVATLAGFLDDDKLCPHAAMALQRVATPAATEALAKALPGATVKGRRIAIVKALGELRATAAAADIRKSAAADEDKDLRMTALWALANIGDAGAGDLLASAARDAKGGYDKSRLNAWEILLIRRTAEAGDKDAAVARAKAIMTDAGGAYPAAARIAAARTLAEIGGAAVAADLLAVADKSGVEPAFRAAVVDAVTRAPGAGVTKALTARLAAATSPDAKVFVLDALARRKDPSAAGAVEAALKDADATVRAAAVRAAASAMPADAAVAALLDRVAKDQATEVARAAADALGRLPGDAAMTAVAKALPDTPDNSRVLLLDVLGQRGTPAQKDAILAQTDRGVAAGVRSAALRALERVVGPADLPKLLDLVAQSTETADETAALRAAVAASAQIPDPDARAGALVGTISTARGAKRGAIEKAVAKLGGKAALAAVVTDTKNPDKETADNALRALAEWQDESALPPLLEVATRPDAPLNQQVIATRGVLAVLKNATKMAPEARVDALAKAMAAAKRPDERKAILSALSTERGPAAFQLAATALDDAALKAEASLAVIKIALPAPAKKEAGLKGAGVAEALNKAIPNCPDKGLKADAQAYLKKL
jgi:HEAT repeat protein